MTGLFQRVGEWGRAGVRLEIDAAPVTALERHALRVAIPTSVVRLPESAFGASGPASNPERSSPARTRRAMLSQRSE